MALIWSSKAFRVGSARLCAPGWKRLRECDERLRDVKRQEAAEIGVALERGIGLAEALARLAARDADHLRLSGVEERREAPWRVLVPYSWAELTVKVPEIIAAGEDEVGRAWRAAQTLSEAERSAALASLQAEHPALRGLARARAGGSILDGPPAGR